MYTGFAIVLSSGAAVAGLVLVRKREGANTIGFSKLAAPAVFVVASAGMVASTVLDDPSVALIGSVLIAAGYPLYLLCHRRNGGVVAYHPDAINFPVIAEETSPE
jgi:hypothetical protein